MQINKKTLPNIETRFEDWEVAVRLHFKAKGWEKYLDAAGPDDQNQSLALSLLVEIISPDLRKYGVTTTSTPYSVWRKIKEVHARHTMLTTSHHIQELANFTVKTRGNRPAERVNDALSRFDALVETLKSHGVEMPEEYLVSTILNAYQRTTYAMTIQALRVTKARVSLAEVASALRDAELSQKFQEPTDQDRDGLWQAFMAKGPRRSSREKKDQRPESMSKAAVQCFHCGKKGHLKKDCYSLVGFPKKKHQDSGMLATDSRTAKKPKTDKHASPTLHTSWMTQESEDDEEEMALFTVVDVDEKGENEPSKEEKQTPVEEKAPLTPLPDNEWEKEPSSPPPLPERQLAKVQDRTPTPYPREPASPPPLPPKSPEDPSTMEPMSKPPTYCDYNPFENPRRCHPLCRIPRDKCKGERCEVPSIYSEASSFLHSTFSPTLG